MNTKTGFLKFIIPPLLMLFLVLLILIFNPIREYGLKQILESLGLGSSSIKEFLVIFGSGSILIITLGFIISTITYSLFNLFGLFAPRWDEKNKTKLRLLFKLETKSDYEIAEWMIHSEYSEYIRNHIQKRWDMCTLNANSILALLLPWFILFWKEIQFSICPILVAVLVLLFFFFYNSYKAFDDINNFDNFLLRNLKNSQAKSKKHARDKIPK